jgi:hypothetical protein
MKGESEEVLEDGGGTGRSGGVDKHEVVEDWRVRRSEYGSG